MAFLAGLATAFSSIAPVISGVGTIAGGLLQASGQQQAASIAAQGQRQAAASQKASLDYQAKQLEMQGKEEQAAAQHEMFQQRRQKDLALSALQARGAASGFETTDPTGLQIGEDIAKYGTLQEMMAAYGGSSRRTGLNAEAIGRRAEGDAIVSGANYSAAGTLAGARSSAMGTILGGLTSGFSRFAEYQPTKTTSYRYS
jgi:hypothetical protein